jgi:hypothetical protein
MICKSNETYSLSLIVNRMSLPAQLVLRYITGSLNSQAALVTLQLRKMPNALPVPLTVLRPSLWILTSPARARSRLAIILVPHELRSQKDGYWLAAEVQIGSQGALYSTTPTPTFPTTTPPPHPTDMRPRARRWRH